MKAGEVSISVGSRIFQEFLHETPIGHLIRVRIDHASELLRRTDLPVSEIAFRCGFRDTNYFSLQFKKTTGLSPREFAVLEALMLRPGAVLSRTQLEDRLYGWGESVESNAVEVYIHGLRRKLGHDFIQNVRGVGYFVPRPETQEGA